MKVTSVIIILVATSTFYVNRVNVRRFRSILRTFYDGNATHFQRVVVSFWTFAAFRLRARATDGGVCRKESENRTRKTYFTVPYEKNLHYKLIIKCRPRQWRVIKCNFRRDGNINAVITTFRVGSTDGASRRSAAADNETLRKHNTCTPDFTSYIGPQFAG